jgi:hypothetical protein
LVVAEEEEGAGRRQQQVSTRAAIWIGLGGSGAWKKTDKRWAKPGPAQMVNSPWASLVRKRVL